MLGVAKTAVPGPNTWSSAALNTLKSSGFVQ